MIHISTGLYCELHPQSLQTIYPFLISNYWIKSATNDVDADDTN